jgi:type VI secretion system protein ImpG
VVRLVEAAAYVFARVKETLEDDVPDVSQALISLALPEALRPVPSWTVVQLRDKGRARRDVVEQPLPRLDSLPVEGSPCTFEPSWRLTTAPITLERATLKLLEEGVQTLTLRLQAYTGMELPAALPRSLRIFVQTRDPVHAIDLVRALHAAREAPRARALDEGGRELRATPLPGVSVRWTALDNLVRVPGARQDRFASGTALRAFFTFPEVFGFFEVNGLDALRGMGLDARILELTFTLDRPVRAELSEARFELDCIPAVNVFPETASLPVRALGDCGTIALRARPGAEVFAVREVHLLADTYPDRAVPVRLWEEQGAPHGYDDDDLYLQIERRGPLPGEAVELCPSLIRARGDRDVPKGRLRIDLLATDGHRTEGLGPGFLSIDDDVFELSNVTRVTPPWSCALAQRIPWRLNAYARMSVFQFACKRSLNAYLELHDPARASTPSVSASGIVAVTRRRVSRVDGTEVHHGDDVDLELDEDALGGPGAAWLVGEFLARALAERADLLRYTHARWVTRDGRIKADYGIRRGDRLPPPFG